MAAAKPAPAPNARAAGTAANHQKGHGPPSAAAEPYAFGQQSVVATLSLPGLDRMSERLCRRLRDILEPLARAKLPVTAAAVRSTTFGEWQGTQAATASLFLYAFQPSNGTVMLSLEPAMVRSLVDVYYGGLGTADIGTVRELTPMEDRLAHKLADAVEQALTEVWSEFLPAQFSFQARESNAAFAPLARRTEIVAAALFEVDFGRREPARIEILYPVSTLRHVERELVDSMRSVGGTSNMAWRRRLRAALGEVRFDARTVLARPELTMAQVMQLQPGDVIPITLGSRVPLIVQNHLLAHGTIGEGNGRVALRVTHIEERQLTS